MAATIREVARRAGVSVSTVSRVLNGFPFVSDAARERVLEAMEALDYRPDVAARSMRTGGSDAVGFVVSDITNPLFAAIAKGADEVLHPRGYQLVLANSGNDPAHEAELISALRQRRVDGLIAAVADETAPGLADRLASVRACVLFDREVRGSSADAVCSDHDRGMREALAHLAELGHRRVALVAGDPTQLGSRARIGAYRSAVRALGLARDRRLVVTGVLGRGTGEDAVRRLLELEDRPTAVVAGNNQLLAGALAALREHGLHAPDDISLVGADDLDLLRLHDPPIDVIDRDLLEHGRAAAEVLLERFADRNAPPRRVLLPTRFLVRGSTGPASRPVARGAAR
jgi:LacI family transcriptional regulator